MYDYGAKTLNESLHIPLRQYAGKYVLIVNVATFWGLTFQYLGKSFRFWTLYQNVGVNIWVAASCIWSPVTLCLLFLTME